MAFFFKLKLYYLNLVPRVSHLPAPGVRFSKLPRTFRARKHIGALFGCFSRVPKSVSQNTRKCPELSPDIFRESLRVTGYDNATRAGGKIILEHGFIITTFNFTS